MNLHHEIDSILLKKNFRGGVEVSFEDDVNKGNGSKIIIVKDKNKKYVLYKSLENFVRFKDWIGKKATVDLLLQPNEKVKTVHNGVLITTRLRTEYKDEEDSSKE